MVVHGIACFLVYFLGFKPYLNYYGPIFLMFEISTIFLNIHWFCDKTGLNFVSNDLVVQVPSFNITMDFY
jgi:hypothetical protein